MTKSLYTTSRWHKLKHQQLAAHPLCVFHLQLGKMVKAEVVDHIIPWRGNEQLFWDSNNLQSLCKLCHDSVKKRFEVSGVAVGHDVTGMPIVKRSHW